MPSQILAIDSQAPRRNTKAPRKIHDINGADNKTSKNKATDNNKKCSNSASLSTTGKIDRLSTYLPPTTAKQLVSNLVVLRNTVPVIPLSKIIQYHDSFPWLQSTKSFNIVIELTVRHSSVGATRKLVKAMQERNIPYNERTRILVTRLRTRVGHRSAYLLRTGRLKGIFDGLSLEEAISEFKPGSSIAIMTGKLADRSLKPVDRPSAKLVTEHLGTPNRQDLRKYKDAYLYALRRELRNQFISNHNPGQHGTQPTGQAEANGAHAEELQNERPGTSPLYEKLFDVYSHATKQPAKDFVPSTPPLSLELLAKIANVLDRKISTRDLFNLLLQLTRRLLLLNQRERAIDLAMTYIREHCKDRDNLPKDLSDRLLRLIHLLIHRKYGCPSYSVGRHTLLSFLEIHPGLKPQANTLFILLQSLERAHGRGTRAYGALKWFRERWEDIEDESVRRTVAKFALQENTMESLRLAQEMTVRESEIGTRWRRPNKARDFSENRLKAFSEIYTREHQDKEKWIRMGLIQRRPGFVLDKKVLLPVEEMQRLRQLERRTMGHGGMTRE
ncbi:hypothetical protein CPB86DRAFT_824510 [Serendipita vermifera]|nr:hypothetical protein CPB86DRAFT_824510 [Serendipita vermifera]